MSILPLIWTNNIIYWGLLLKLFYLGFLTCWGRDAGATSAMGESKFGAALFGRLFQIWDRQPDTKFRRLERTSRHKWDRLRPNDEERIPRNPKDPSQNVGEDRKWYCSRIHHVALCRHDRTLWKYKYINNNIFYVIKILKKTFKKIGL